MQVGPNPKPLLVFSAAGDLAVALLHVGIVAMGPKAYAYFGAVSLAMAAQRGELWPSALTLAVGVVCAAWGAYALSGARLIRPLPLLRTVLTCVSALYLLRGLVVIPDLLRIFAGAEYPLRQTIFSAISLLLGITHTAGTAMLFRSQKRIDGSFA